MWIQWMCSDYCNKKNEQFPLFSRSILCGFGPSILSIAGFHMHDICLLTVALALFRTVLLVVEYFSANMWNTAARASGRRRMTLSTPRRLTKCGGHVLPQFFLFWKWKAWGLLMLHFSGRQRGSHLVSWCDHVLSPWMVIYELLYQIVLLVGR